MFSQPPLRPNLHFSLPVVSRVWFIICYTQSAQIRFLRILLCKSTTEQKLQGLYWSAFAQLRSEGFKLQIRQKNPHHYWITLVLRSEILDPFTSSSCMNPSDDRKNQSFVHNLLFYYNFLYFILFGIWSQVHSFIWRDYMPKRFRITDL